MSVLNFTNILLIAGSIIVLGLIAIYFAVIFNRLFRYRNAADASLGQIRVSMKKRLDMIEQLLGAVKGYITHERDVFENVSKMRTKIFEAGTIELSEIEKESRNITGNIIALAESYPDLKANQTVTKLMDAIISVEEEIARHRYTYNNVVQEINTMIDTIPSNFVATSTGLDKLNYLSFEPESEERPDLSRINRN